MDIARIKEIFSLFYEAQELREQELQEFLDFYKNIVELIPAEASKAFGRLSVEVYVYKTKRNANYGIDLTVTDYVWWVDQFKYNKVRLIDSPIDIKHKILNRITETIESYLTSPEHKKALMELLVGK